MADLWSAAIGAGGALFGGVLAGGFSLLKGRQEAANSERDRVEQRMVLHRTSRREAYLAVLAAYSEVDRRTDAVMRMRPPPTANLNVAEEFYAADEALRSLREAVAAAQLEGPIAVAEAASALWSACWERHVLLADCTAGNIGSSTQLYALADAADEEKVAAPHTARRSFLDAAQAAVGGNAPGFG
ncbi:hypothetical protein [Streptomyces lavendulocolor]|uniref:hypothetical protein n=1 Tax=Streptomyces lavendulocolor TaxID=67316 RepID=UPI003C2C6CAF